MEDDARKDGRWRFRTLGNDDVAVLQRFFDANPEYFHSVNGEPPRPDEAQHELDDLPPADMPYREMLLLGFFDESSGALAGMATIIGDFLVDHVWHLGLFIVATALHGSGAAHALYRQLERWMQERGAHWIRLGVVSGNTRAERFWERQGYVQVRERGPLQMGQRTNLLRVLVKPLDAGTLEQYLALVARDRPDTA
jgi:ribosomal protein S18 acetylase RimI-like enzyme